MILLTTFLDDKKITIQCLKELAEKPSFYGILMIIMIRILKNAYKVKERKIS